METEPRHPILRDVHLLTTNRSIRISEQDERTTTTT